MDSSFSLDENANRCPFKVPDTSPNATSTPRKPKPAPKNKISYNKYKCEHCGRGYQIGHYYRLHHEKVQSRWVVREVRLWISVCLCFYINISFSFLRQWHLLTFMAAVTCLSVNFKMTRTHEDTTTTDSFKRLAAPAQVSKMKKDTLSKTKKKATLICTYTYCLKGYVCSSSFKMHIC